MMEQMDRVGRIRWFCPLWWNVFSLLWFNSFLRMYLRIFWTSLRFFIWCACKLKHDNIFIVTGLHCNCHLTLFVRCVFPDMVTEINTNDRWMVKIMNKQKGRHLVAMKRIFIWNAYSFKQTHHCYLRILYPINFLSIETLKLIFEIVATH